MDNEGKNKTADWSQLPNDLLGQVAESLDTTLDHFRFRHVCSKWRSSVEAKRRRLSGEVPLLPDENNATNSVSSSSGFSLSKRTIFVIRTPRNEQKRWLIKVEEGASDRKRLLNPMNRCIFDFGKVLDIQNLLLLEIGHEYVLKDALEMEKLILMHLGEKKNSNLNEFVLLTIHSSNKLAMYKSENNDWVILEQYKYDDVILYKGKFYAVDNRGRTVFVDHSRCEVNLVADPVLYGGSKKYLVECKGDLLLVESYLRSDARGDRRFRNYPFPGTGRGAMFKVYRLDWKQKEWFQVENLRDDVLFLGKDCAFSSSADDLGLRQGNRILFLGHHRFYSSVEGNDAGCTNGVSVFDFESGLIDSFGNDPELSKLFWPPPSWFVPLPAPV